MSSYYDILGVTPTASVEEIRKSYRRLALRWHPDKNQNNLAEATRRFREISEAYEVLSDAERRSVYDANRSNRRSDFEWPSTFVFRDPQEIFRDFFTFFDELDPLASTYHEHDFHHTNVFSSTSTSDEDDFDESTIFPDVPYKRTMMVGMLQFFFRMDNFHQFPSLIVTSANRDRSHIRTAKRSKSIRCFAMDMKWKKCASTICWSVVSSMESNRNCPNCQPPHQRRAALVTRSWAKSLLDAICMTLLL